ncbi:MAG: hypothetical protein QM760_22265 [Nibricoccus sp.]
MAHVRQELGLGARVGLGGIASAQEFFFDLFALGNIAGDAEKTVCLAGLADGAGAKFT